jgi:glycosyltransferase involved in cell wall biosynthesis
MDDGTPAFVADLALELATEFEVRVLAPAVPGGAPRERLGERVEIIRYRYFPRRWEDLADGAILENVRSRRSRLLQVPFLLGGLARAVRGQVREFRPDAIHAHWIIPQGMVARPMARGIPTVVTTLGGDLYALNSAVLRAQKSKVLEAAAAVTVMNEDMRARAIELGADPAVTRVMPMGARLATLGHDVVTEPVPSAQGGPLRLLAVGRLVEKKGFDILLRALRDVSFPFELEIVGDGPEREHLEALAGDMPVAFAGQLGREDLAQRYLGSDIAVFPSRRARSGDQDGLPVAMLEAMGAGTAIVATDLPGLNEALQADVSGLIVPEGDELALTRSLDRLAANPDLRADLGAAARERAQSYSLQAVGAGYRELFNAILQR